jgi:hypothetical protein
VRGSPKAAAWRRRAEGESSRRAAHCRLGLGFVGVRFGFSALPVPAAERLLAPLVREEAVVVGVQRACGRDGHASAEQQLARRLARLACGGAVAGATHRARARRALLVIHPGTPSTSGSTSGSTCGSSTSDSLQEAVTESDETLRSLGARS